MGRIGHAHYGDFVTVKGEYRILTDLSEEGTFSCDTGR